MSGRVGAKTLLTLASSGQRFGWLHAAQRAHTQCQYHGGGVNLSSTLPNQIGQPPFLTGVLFDREFMLCTFPQVEWQGKPSECQTAPSVPNKSQKKNHSVSNAESCCVVSHQNEKPARMHNSQAHHRAGSACRMKFQVESI